MTARPLVVVLAPLAPSATGNGLAMRIDLLVRAAALAHDVVVSVVPVAGRLPEPRPTLDVPTVEVEPSADHDPAPLVEWLAEPRWRHLVADLAPLPDPVAGASPVRTARAVGEAVARIEPSRPISGVVASRLSTAPAAAVLAHGAGAALVIDADDDDEAHLRRLGSIGAAEAWNRVAAATLPVADLVLAAGPDDAAGLARRHGVEVRVVPNAVDLVPPVEDPPGEGRLLVVGNLSYGPNEAGARWLVGEVLPGLPGWTVHLVGQPSATVAAMGGPRVVVHGAVDQLRPHYAAADVVAVPLLDGAGTRIKVLEAFAHGRPVVSTTVGAAGIDAQHGRHLLLADDPADFATAVREAAVATRRVELVGAARALVADAYDARRVAADAGRLIARAVADRGRLARSLPDRTT